MALLKLIALDPADLPVLSAHLQDAVVRVGDMAFDARDRRFGLHCNRFNWQAEKADPASRERHRAALRIERVSHLQSQGFDPQLRNQVLSVLALVFVADPDAVLAPQGTLTIVCAGGASLRLTVECVELVLEDLGPVWAASSVPEHPGP